jgi:hypothetical protein
MIRVFRAGLREFGLFLDIYNIALLVPDLQTIFFMPVSTTAVPSRHQSAA